MSDPSSVTVVGRGTSAVQPDRLRVHVGVETLGAGPDQALEACARTLDRVRTAVRDCGVQPQHLQTSRLSLQPEWERTGAPMPRLVGYLVSTALVVTLTDIDRLGATLSAAVDAGGEAARVHGIGWALADAGQAEASARESAFVDARARAEQYARLAGLALGRVVRITEPGAAEGYARPLARGAAFATAATVEADPGEVDVSASVTVTWELV